mmetsp:Transcript_50241/g.116646  ORF Transcript_50241/g.116646 Transcript_50241/m.116646 type:complete len:149 (-) Transcript_50241:120-566(-)
MGFLLELLFWLPTLMDFLLLFVTLGSLETKGQPWLYSVALPEPERKHFNEGATVSEHAQARIETVWDIAMAAYSAYACLFGLALYWCYTMPEMRGSFCVAMTCLMLKKLALLQKFEGGAFKDGKTLTIIFFYLPTYGGYAVLKLLSLA